MSQGSFAPQPVDQPQAGTSNGVGIAGFVLSILGILSCGVLAPFGLLLSGIGLLWRPRGMAIAGTVVSLIGCVLLGTVGFVTVKGFLGLKELGESAALIISTTGTLQQARTKIDQYKVANAKLPDDQEGQTLITEFKDAWKNGLHYHQIDADKYEIRSSGLDGQFHTADDLTSDEPIGVIDESGDAGSPGDATIPDDATLDENDASMEEDEAEDDTELEE